MFLQEFSVTLNVLILTIMVFTIIFVYKKYIKIVKEAEQDTAPDISEQIHAVVYQSFVKALESEEVQGNLMQVVVGSLLAEDEEGNNYLGQLIKANVTEILNEFSEQFTKALNPLASVDAGEGLSNEKLQEISGSLAVNAMDELLPPGAGLILSRIFPDWQEQAKTNPKGFVQLIAMAKNMGLFDMLGSFNLGLNGNKKPFSNVQNTGF